MELHSEEPLDQNRDEVADLIAETEERQLRSEVWARNICLVLWSVSSSVALLCVRLVHNPALVLFAAAFGFHCIVTYVLFGRKSLGRFSSILSTSADHKGIIALAERDDIRVIGPLALYLGCADAVHTNRIVHTLVRLLPRLEASNAPDLRLEHRVALARTLVSTAWAKSIRLAEVADFRVAVLQALTKVGSEESLFYVEKWIRRHPINTGDRAIIEAARTCYAAIKERARANDAMLLRASSLQAVSGTLLRPVTTLDGTAPEQLVRPVEERLP